MTVDLTADLDLSEGVHSQQRAHVHDLGELDAVAGDERQLFQQGPPACELTGQRLHQPGELWPVQVEQGARDEFGDPAATAGQQPPGQRPVVGRLDVGHRALGQQRPEQPGDQARVEVLQVGVDEDHDVPGRGVQGLPQSLALARDPPVAGEDSLLGEHRGARGGRLGGGRVDRPRIDDNDLVDEGDRDHEIATDRRDDRADGGRLVQRGQYHADRLYLTGQ